VNTTLFPKNISEVFSKVIFAGFYVLLLLEFVAVFHNSSAPVLTLAVVTIFFLATLFSSFWGIWAFVATIPFINGFFVMKGWGDVSLPFVGVYLAWFPKYICKNKSFQYPNSVVFLVNLLVTIIVLNVCLVFIRIVEFPIPSHAWFEWFLYFPFVNQKDNLWQINAALILLQGLLLFRMLVIEITSRHQWNTFTKTIYVQAVIIVGFSLLQFINFKTRGSEYLGLYLPFNDIHSYGSYAVLLLLIFTSFLLNKITTKLVGNEDQPDKGIIKYNLAGVRCFLSKIAGHFYVMSSKRVTNGLFAIIFFFLCCYSSSRTTWIAMGVTLFFLVITSIKNRKLIIGLGFFVVLALIAGNLYSPKLLQSNNASLARLGSFLNVSKINKEKSLLIRFELWDRSIEMVKDYPLAGVGLGNFYRNNVYYKDSSLGKWDSENAHNYYLQLLAELGIPGLILFLSILFALYSRQCTLPVGKTESLLHKDSVKPFLYGLSAYLITMLTGHPLLISTQQFLFWAIVAIIVKGHMLTSGNEELKRPGNKILKITAVFVFSLFVFGFIKNLYKKEPWTIPVEYGLYSVEKMHGARMRWMAGKAEYYLPETAQKLNLKVVAQPFNSQKPEGLTLVISINDHVVDQVHFVEGGTETLSYDLSSVDKGDIKVNLEVTKVFCPKKVGLNNDSRILGVALSVDG